MIDNFNTTSHRKYRKWKTFINERWNSLFLKLHYKYYSNELADILNLNYNN